MSKCVLKYTPQFVHIHVNMFVCTYKHIPYTEIITRIIGGCCGHVLLDLDPFHCSIESPLLTACEQVCKNVCTVFKVCVWLVQYYFGD